MKTSRLKQFLVLFLLLVSCEMGTAPGESSLPEPVRKEKTANSDSLENDGSKNEQGKSSAYQSTENGLLEYPKIQAGEQIIAHHAYALCYSEPHEQAKWVAYELTANETNKRYERSDHFLTDPMVRSGSADNSDYKGSGFDRGHLAPAADMGWSSIAMNESFYYSNMSPQEPGFNRGIWKRLEEQVRSWALELGSIYIVTGPVLNKNLPSIGNGVTIPQEYYKVILFSKGTNTRAIGFLLPNASSRSSLQAFAVSVDRVEQITGIDFFPKLDDKIEGQVEKTVCTTCWSWSRYQSKSSSSETTSVQCSGTTQKGLRCKRRTKNVSGRCYQHQ
jgi:endonuclease G